MVAKSYITRSLSRIDRLYRGPCSAEEALFYSKLATLELCGWIEVSMDDIVARMAKRLLRYPADRVAYERDVVRRVHGFDYDRHFKRLLLGLVGYHGVAWMERRVDAAVFNPMCGALSSLKPVRDQLAHTYVKGTTLSFDAPSVARARFAIVYAGLKDVEAVLAAFK